MQERGDYIRRLACRLLDNWAAKDSGEACKYVLTSHPAEDINAAISLIKDAGIVIAPELSPADNVFLKT